jgi:hypothetical protein
MNETQALFVGFGALAIGYCIGRVHQVLIFSREIRKAVREARGAAMRRERQERNEDRRRS